MTWDLGNTGIPVSFATDVSRCHTYFTGTSKSHRQSSEREDTQTGVCCHQDHHTAYRETLSSGPSNVAAALERGFDFTVLNLRGRTPGFSALISLTLAAASVERWLWSHISLTIFQHLGCFPSSRLPGEMPRSVIVKWSLVDRYTSFCFLRRLTTPQPLWARFVFMLPLSFSSASEVFKEYVLVFLTFNWKGLSYNSPSQLVTHYNEITRYHLAKLPYHVWAWGGVSKLASVVVGFHAFVVTGCCPPWHLEVTCQEVCSTSLHPLIAALDTDTEWLVFPGYRQ